MPRGGARPGAGRKKKAVTEPEEKRSVGRPQNGQGKRYCLYIPADQTDALDRIAAARGLKPAALLRIMIADFISMNAQD